MFYRCTCLQNVDGLINEDVRNGKKFQNMFSMHDGMQKLDCLLTNLDGLKNWDVSNGIDFMNMFSGCSSFQNVDGLINWTVSKVKSLGLRFKEECFVVVFIKKYGWIKKLGYF